MISENQDQYGTRSKIKITNNDLDYGKDQDQWNDLDLLRAKINDLMQICLHGWHHRVVCFAVCNFANCSRIRSGFCLHCPCLGRACEEIKA